MTVEPIPAFNDNYLWLIHHGKIAAIVDPGDATPVLKRLSEKGLDLKYILITHHHMDHIGGIRTLKAKFPDVKVFGPGCGRIPCIDEVMQESNIIDLGSLGTYNVIEVPGHTSSHIAYYSEDSLFIGDTVFAVGCGRLFEGTPAQMVNSFEKLRLLPEQTKIYCAHEYTMSNIKFAKTIEPDNESLQKRDHTCRQLRSQDMPTVPFTLAEELSTNPFFRYNSVSVRKAASQKAGRSINTPEDTFAVLRSWKDSF
jgi:hydroxyacylglutathione hydrolase